jgi:hypothetical protein
MILIQVNFWRWFGTRMCICRTSHVWTHLCAYATTICSVCKLFAWSLSQRRQKIFVGPCDVCACVSVPCSHRNLSQCWKEGNFFQLVSNLFCAEKRGFVEPSKMFLCSKLPCLGWRSADFLQGFFCQKWLLDQREHTRSSVTFLCMFVSLCAHRDQLLSWTNCKTVKVYSQKTVFGSRRKILKKSFAFTLKSCMYM